MSNIFQITVLALGVALVSFGLHGCPPSALAFTTSAPVTVSNGDVGLTVPSCSAGDFLTGNGSNFSCSTPSSSSGPVKTLKRKTSDQAFLESAAGAAVTDLTGFTFSGSKKYEIGGVLHAKQDNNNADVSLALVDDGSGTLTGWKFIFEMTCIAGSNKSDAQWVASDAASTGYITCDLGNTDNQIVRISGYAYGGSSDVTLDLYAQNSASGSGERDYNIEEDSRMWIEEVN